MHGTMKRGRPFLFTSLIHEIHPGWQCLQVKLAEEHAKIKIYAVLEIPSKAFKYCGKFIEMPVFHNTFSDNR